MPFRRNLANLRIKKAREITAKIIRYKPVLLCLVQACAPVSGPWQTQEPCTPTTPDDINYVEWTLMSAAYVLERHLLTTKQA